MRSQLLPKLLATLLLALTITDTMAADVAITAGTPRDRTRPDPAAFEQLDGGRPSASVIPIREGGDRITGFLLRVEDNALAEVLEVDAMRDQIRAFGLAFSPERDATGNAIGITISGNGEAFTARMGDDINSLSPQQRASVARLSKFFAASNGAARSRRAIDALRRIQVERASSPEAHLDVFDCTMDIIGLVLDWLTVVAACGAPVVNVFTCGFAIAWATADTVRIAQAIGTDCGPNS